MSAKLALEALWNASPRDERVFPPDPLLSLPATARHYLEHAIAPGTRVASAVRLRMHGEIKLKGWFPFTAEQVISWDQGMIWNATVRMHGIPIRGFDRLLNHAGEMQWKILGLIPLMRAAGADITRSAAGRVLAEAVWLPSVFCREDAVWKEGDSSHASVCIAVEGERPELTLAVNEIGRLQSVALKRWGKPEGAEYHYASFGGIVEQEATFEGYTIPTQLRVGWGFGTPQFDTEGEFFRCFVDHAEFR